MHVPRRQVIQLREGLVREGLVRKPERKGQGIRSKGCLMRKIASDMKLAIDLTISNWSNSTIRLKWNVREASRTHQVGQNEESRKFYHKHGEKNLTKFGFLSQRSQKWNSGHRLKMSEDKRRIGGVWNEEGFAFCRNETKSDPAKDFFHPKIFWLLDFLFLRRLMSTVLQNLFPQLLGTFFATENRSEIFSVTKSAVWVFVSGCL